MSLKKKHTHTHTRNERWQKWRMWNYQNTKKEFYSTSKENKLLSCDDFNELSLKEHNTLYLYLVWHTKLQEIKHFAKLNLFWQWRDCLTGWEGWENERGGKKLATNNRKKVTKQQKVWLLKTTRSHFCLCIIINYWFINRKLKLLPTFFLLPLVLLLLFIAFEGLLEIF